MATEDMTYLKVCDESAGFIDRERDSPTTCPDSNGCWKP